MNRHPNAFSREAGSFGEMMNASLPFLQTEIEGSIPERFARVVRAYPDRLAVKVRTAQVCYRELDRLSNGIANALLLESDLESTPIALLVDRGILPLAMMLGVLKAGKFFIPLDPSWPTVRICQILKESQARVLLTTRQTHTFTTNLTCDPLNVLMVEEMEARFLSEPVGMVIAPDSPAAVFYTSGSIGQPKGVLITHRQILAEAWMSTQALHINAEDRQSQLFAYSFGASLFDTYSTICNGATLYPYELKEEGTDHLSAWLQYEEITLTHIPIVLFRQLVKQLLPSSSFPHLRICRLGGQRLYKKDVDWFKQCFPETCLLMHGYSSTEAGRVTAMAITHQAELANHVVPAGYAMNTKEITILDDFGQPVGYDTAGEIAIRSRYLSPGYWNDLELTRQKFLPDPDGGDKRIYLTGDLGRMRPDGCLEYLGRKDFMVKIRGYRVVLTEIEAALYAMESVKEAVVVAKERTEGEKFLVAYIVPAATPAPTVSALRQALAQTLLDYMLPSFFVFLDALPLTPTGKPDRQALPELDYTRPALANAYVAPQNDTEQRLAEIWAQTLDLDRVGIHDNFFDLGGNSLLAGKVLSDIKQAFRIDVPMSALFQAPTIAQLAERLRPSPQSSSCYSILPIQPHGTQPPLFFIYPLGRAAHYSVQGTYKLAKLLGQEQPLYGVRYGLAKTQHLDELPIPPRRIDAIARHYLDEIRQIQPTGPYYLAGRSGGGIIAFEMACQLSQQGAQTAVLALLDSFHPERHRTDPLPLMQRISYLAQRLCHPYTGFMATYRTTRYLYTLRQNKEAVPFWRYWWKLFKLNYVIRHRVRYVPQVYPGNVVFFESSEQHALWRARCGWERFINGQLEIITVPGWHGNMMEESHHLEVMTAHLQRHLQEAQKLSYDSLHSTDEK